MFWRPSRRLTTLLMLEWARTCYTIFKPTLGWLLRAFTLSLATESSFSCSTRCTNNYHRSCFFISASESNSASTTSDWRNRTTNTFRYHCWAWRMVHTNSLKRFSFKLSSTSFTSSFRRIKWTMVGKLTFTPKYMFLLEQDPLNQNKPFVPHAWTHAPTFSVGDRWPNLHEAPRRWQAKQKTKNKAEQDPFFKTWCRVLDESWNGAGEIPLHQMEDTFHYHPSIEGDGCDQLPRWGLHDKRLIASSMY